MKNEKQTLVEQSPHATDRLRRAIGKLFFQSPKEELLDDVTETEQSFNIISDEENGDIRVSQTTLHAQAEYVLRHAPHSEVDMDKMYENMDSLMFSLPGEDGITHHTFIADKELKRTPGTFARSYLLCDTAANEEGRVAEVSHTRKVDDIFQAFPQVGSLGATVDAYSTVVLPAGSIITTLKHVKHNNDNHDQLEQAVVQQERDTICTVLSAFGMLEHHDE